MISNATDIIDAANKEIVSIIRDCGIDLVRKGANYVACCPFHNEKTPSFTVFPQTGTYKCFGCGEGGDSINFIREHEGMGFIEAVERAAAIIRKTVEYDNSNGSIQEKRDKERKEKAHKEAQSVQLEHVLQFWQSEGLPFQDIEIIGDKEKEVFVSIGGRLFSSKALKAWDICYAPKGNVVYKHAVKQKWPKTLLQETGIIVADGDRFYDFFRDRIIFPIYNYKKQLVGFAGRILPGSKQPAKYVNSKQSLLFDKSELLYGIDKARRYIVKKEEAILVEGYTDVIQLHHYGFQNTVAGMGTSFTQQQAQLIKRSTKQVLFLKDGDAAGLESMRRDVLIALKNGLMPSIVILPDGEDPDSYVRINGKKVLEKYIQKHRQDGLIWRVMEEHDKDNVHKQINAIQLAADLILLLDSEMAREAYIKKLTATNKLGRVTKEIRKAIEDKENIAIRQGTHSLSADQSNDVRKYGFFERTHAYWACNDPEGHSALQITNFVIEPIMLIVARQRKPEAGQYQESIQIIFYRGY